MEGYLRVFRSKQSSDKIFHIYHIFSPWQQCVCVFLLFLLLLLLSLLLFLKWLMKFGWKNVEELSLWKWARGFRNAVQFFHIATQENQAQYNPHKAKFFTNAHGLKEHVKVCANKHFCKNKFNIMTVSSVCFM